jgi:hypothetical protein
MTHGLGFSYGSGALEYLGMPALPFRKTREAAGAKHSCNHETRRRSPSGETPGIYPSLPCNESCSGGSQCPLCFDFRAQALGEYQNHVVDHLEAIAFSAFPEFLSEAKTHVDRPSRDIRASWEDPHKKGDDIESSFAKLSIQTTGPNVHTRLGEELHLSDLMGQPKGPGQPGADSLLNSPSNTKSSITGSSDKQETSLQQRQTLESESEATLQGAITPLSSSNPPTNRLDRTPAVTATRKECSGSNTQPAQQPPPWINTTHSE